MEARFYHKGLLNGLDVKQMLMVKEETPEDHRSVAELHDPKPQQIKEEEEEVCIILGTEQLNAKEETDVAPIKSEDDKESILLSQNLYQDHIKSRELSEEAEDDFISVVIKDDEEDSDVNHSVSELEHLSDSGQKTEDEDSDWKERGAPESDGNINNPCSSSEFPEESVHCCPVQEDVTHSETGSSSSLHKECFTEKKSVESGRKVQTGMKFSCEDCGKALSGKYTLNTHKTIHTGQKAFCCDVCGRRFGDKSGLKRHKIIHTGDKPFCCDVCGQRFGYKSSINTHMITHTGQKPFSCDICGQRFSQKGSLNTHVSSHTGQKHFCCDLCGQRFNRKSSLNTHMRTHTGQKPFCCDICGQRFSQKSTLTTHARIHTGQKPFCCDVCGRRFGDKSSLNRHKIIHTGQQPFCCVICGRRFGNKSSLNRHMRIHSGGEIVLH
ncbi:oocyte zinc finger protein XlCOF6.1-like [Poecilia latipinna]|uniref:oocyte zinc finger protein XlCOF6.1-like n=1 Tax=Poecilia latipinna TaxID=48699 RepID=UPI00072E10E1|nr:PREDICTED: oocyte zinc finger protein XlCOF6.1-like [Poecilia latipinna]